VSSVHFILTGGELHERYRRAIRSATVHEAPIHLWHTGERPYTSGLPLAVTMPLEPPVSGLHPAHVWDVLAFLVAAEHGGLVLGLDTISVRPALDLLGEYDLVASRDFSEEEMAGGITASPYTMTFVARQGSDLVRAMYEESLRRARQERETWAFTGPDVLRDFIDTDPRASGVPYPALCGWNSRYIWRFYFGYEEPHPNTRVIHLFSQGDVKPLFWGDFETFIMEHPGLTNGRLDTNAALFAL
jgi:hypothetical protein